jgi:putative NADPH-quinone reductase
MRVHVVHAHPVETSYNRSLFTTIVQALGTGGHEVDALSLYDEQFDAVLSRAERLAYHHVPENVTEGLRPFVDRLRAADAMVFVHPVWNYGYPAILKGYFDRVFLPGVSFMMDGGGDRGKLRPNLTNIKKVAFVTSYGGNRWRTMLMGDPPRRLARRWAWATFRTTAPPRYLALYDINNCTPDGLKQFQEKVRSEFSKF